MNLLVFLYIVSILSFFIYTSLIVSKYSIPVSYTETLYFLKHKVLYVLWKSSILIPLSITWIYYTKEQSYQFLVILTLIGLILPYRLEIMPDRFNNLLSIIKVLLYLVSALMWSIIYTNMWKIFVIIIVTYSIWGLQLRGSNRHSIVYHNSSSKNSLLFFLELMTYSGIYLSLSNFLNII